MGASAILVILCHSVTEGVSMPAWLSYLLGLGNIGVDAFLFVSGIGMYYSLSKSPAIHIWLHARYKRIFIPYLIITIPYWIYYSITNEIGIGGFLFHASTIGYWFTHYGAWYVALLVPLYFLTPLISRCIDSHSNRWLTVAILSAIIFMACELPIDQFSGHTYALFDNLQRAFCRVPIYIIGYGLAPSIKNRVMISPVVFLIPIAIMLLIQHIPSLNNFPRGWLLTFPYIYILIQILNFKDSLIRCILKWFGIISLESYLVNVFLSYWLKPVFVNPENAILQGNYFYYSVVIVIGTIIAFYAHKLSSLINNLLPPEKAFR